jgi:hypothetical protein
VSQQKEKTMETEKNEEKRKDGELRTVQQVARQVARQVASFRFPVSVKSLDSMVEILTHEYGRGLTMRQVGEFLIIEKPALPS